MFTRFLVVLSIAAITASAPSLAAKNPKGCSRSGARPANPQGSVLVQTPANSATAARSVAPMVFGKSQRAAGTATIVPDITADTAPKASTPQPRPTTAAPAKRKKSKRFLFFSAAALPSSSSC